MITAYSVKPRLSRTQENKPKPQFANLDELIDAMKADAKEISKRHERDRPPAQEARGVIAEARVFDFVKENPGASVHEIAAHFSREPKSIASLLSRMEGRNTVKASMRKNPTTGRPVRCFAIAQEPPEKSGVRLSPVRDKLVAFIKAHPGCTTAQVAKHMGCSNKSAADKIAFARKTINIVSKRSGPSNNAMALHWLEE
jgi:DNA-binding MarR family transcriptional regulator